MTSAPRPGGHDAVELVGVDKAFPRPVQALTAGSTLGASHQLWQVNEVNKLIWPAPAGAGTIDEAAWARTVEVARTAVNADGDTVITTDPDAEAYTNEYVEQALELLRADGVDVEGTSYAPAEVTLNAGGS